MIYTLFYSRLTTSAESLKKYERHAREIEARAYAEASGFVGIKSFTAEDGERLSIVCFEDEESQLAWKMDGKHIEAQALGKSEYYESFRLTVCKELSDQKWPAERPSEQELSSGSGRTLSEEPLSGEVCALITALLEELGDEAAEASTLEPQTLARALQQSGAWHRVLVARNQSGAAIALCTLSESFALYANGTYGVINEMYVVPDQRSSGVGEDLLRFAMAIGRKRSWRRIEVTAPTDERFMRTRSFYERHGFEFTGPKLRKLL